VFEQNSLEQLMINFANERLQRHFNKHVFEKEQQTYKEEDINWKFVTYNDNSEIVQLISGAGEKDDKNVNS